MTVYLGQILYEYGVNPSRVEDYGKVKKIYSNRGIYALKETQLSAEERSRFIHLLKRLQHLGFDRYAAPYLTRNGDSIAIYEGKTYYLMPWLTEAEPGILSKEERLIEVGAVLHSLTEKELTYSGENIEASFEGLDKRLAAHVLEIEQFAKKAEEQIYFSPFELAFLSHFSTAMKAAEFSRHHLNSWLRHIKDQERFRVVLCHGKLTTNHLINGDLLNFEHAVLDSPVRDLATLFRTSLMKFPHDTMDEPFDWLRTYEERFPLRKEEKILLGAYLTFPETVCMAVREYESRAKTEGELVQVEKLEYRTRSLEHCLKMADQLMADL
ncbi:MAG TPA: hypothetical protein VFK37_09830 [Bacillales bacterium]|nr:hypothetical protein [Bacillales bacterium]